MKTLRHTFAAIAAVGLFSVSALAADPSGSWKWTQTSSRGGGTGTPREITVTLAMQGGQLTGTVAMPSRGGGAPTSIAISNASCKGDTVSFEVEREYNGNKVVTKYTGKLQGDTIKGSIVSPGRDGGEPQKREWEARRVK